MSKSRSKLEDIFDALEKKRLKRHLFGDWNFKYFTYKDNPFLKLIPKDNQPQGTLYRIPIEYGEKDPKTK